MKVLITGGSGVIGSKFIRFFEGKEHEVHYTFLSNEHVIGSSVPHKLDISDRDAVVDLVKKVNPNIVIHTAALTNVDFCETNNDIAEKINVEGTRNVVDGCKGAGSKIIYISTSFVFDGKKEKFFEYDKRNAVNYYGLTKIRGENIVEKSGIPYLILRIDQPYTTTESWQKKNSVLRILENFQENKTIIEPSDWCNTPTYVENFIDVSAELIKMDKNGIYNVVGSDFLSRFEWAFKIADVFGGDKKLIQKISSGDLNLPAKRPNVHLDNLKAQKESGMRLVGVLEGMKMMRIYMKTKYLYG